MLSDDRDFPYQPQGDGRFQLKDGKKRSAAIGIFLLLIFLEACLSKTGLITPLNSIFQWTVVAIGAGASLWAGMRMKDNLTYEGGPLKATLTILALMIAGGFLFYHLAWRVANHWEFAFSGAPFEWASYPIVAAEDGRGRRSSFQTASVSIAPYTRGETKIPIPNEQYDHLSNHFEGYCVTVKQRRSASGAIQVAGAGDRRLSVPSHKNIRSCDMIEPQPPR